MAERAITQQVRKSQFLTNLAPLLSYDELVRNKLESGKFPLTKTGWIKIISVIVLLAGLSIFLALSSCEDGPVWYPYLFPSCIGANIAVELLLYIIFSAGCTVKHPGRWVKTDIFLNLIFSIIAIISSVMTTVTKCDNKDEMRGIPGPIGIAGSTLSIIGCAAIFLMYRYVEEEEDVPQTPISRSMDPRKSMHA